MKNHSDIQKLLNRILLGENAIDQLELDINDWKFTGFYSQDRSSIIIRSSDGLCNKILTKNMDIEKFINDGLLLVNKDVDEILYTIAHEFGHHLYIKFGHNDATPARNREIRFETTFKDEIDIIREEIMAWFYGGVILKELHIFNIKYIIRSFKSIIGYIYGGVKVKLENIYYRIKGIERKKIDVEQIRKELEEMESIRQQLEAEGYEYAVAIATQAEIEAGAACGQLALITEEE